MNVQKLLYQKNILWLVSWYPNALNLYEGDFIQRHARAVSLFQNITVIFIKKDEKGIVTKDVKIVSSSENNLNEVIVYYHSLRTGVRFIDRLFSTVKYKKVYRKTFENYIHKKGKPDIVHVHVAMKAGLQALYLKRKFKIPYIISEHWSGYYKEAKENFYNSSFLIRRYTIKVLAEASLLLPVTKQLGEAINDIVKIPFEVIANVVDTRLFSYQPHLSITFRFIHASSLNYYKNPEGIIRSVAQLAKEGLRFELLLIGETSSHLANLADELLLTDKFIFFKPPVSYARIAEEMNHSSALVLFSRVESLPCIMLEALCCGLPVVSSDVGAINTVINETNGLLVESENEKQLVNAMRKMILDYDSYNKIAIAVSATNKFNYQTVGERIIEVYNKLGK
ncbi:MAG: glycosyltransferase [Ginsengibacter sp.]